MLYSGGGSLHSSETLYAMYNNTELKLSSKKNRVFFHELGHFVANTINTEVYGLSPVDKIKITRELINNNLDFVGETIYFVPIGEDSKKPLVNLPQKLADLIYGCYFQSIHIGSDLKICFDYSNPDANGKIDMENVISALSQFSVSPEKRKVFYPYIEQDYFQELKEKGSELETFFRLVPEDYYTEINDFETEVDIKKLKRDTSDGITAHRNTYLRFISEIENILEWNK